MVAFLVALLCTLYVISPDPLPVIIDDVVVGAIAIGMWRRFLHRD